MASDDHCIPMEAVKFRVLERILVLPNWHKSMVPGAILDVTFGLGWDTCKKKEHEECSHESNFKRIILEIEETLDRIKEEKK